MTKTAPRMTQKTREAQQARTERLAAALRDNLKRRKQQKRGRDEAAEAALGPAAPGDLLEDRPIPGIDTQKE